MSRARRPSRLFAIALATGLVLAGVVWPEPAPVQRPTSSVATIPGMLPVVDPMNLYSETGSGRASAAVANPPRILRGHAHNER